MQPAPGPSGLHGYHGADRIEAAIIAWEATIQATALVRRARRRAPSAP
jgi:hypothetical protein